jgi:hypothetical protein
MLKDAGSVHQSEPVDLESSPFNVQFHIILSPVYRSSSCLVCSGSLIKSYLLLSSLRHACYMPVQLKVEMGHYDFFFVTVPLIICEYTLFGPRL